MVYRKIVFVASSFLSKKLNVIYLQKRSLIEKYAPKIILPFM